MIRNYDGAFPTEREPRQSAIVATTRLDRVPKFRFGVLGLIPAERHARVVEASVTWNYTTWLNIGFLVVAAFLVWRFLRTGGPAMLRMMNKPIEPHAAP